MVHTKVSFCKIIILKDLFGSKLRLEKILIDDKIGPWKALPNGRTHNECVECLNKKLELNY